MRAAYDDGLDREAILPIFLDQLQAEQVAPLKELLDMRKRLDEVLAKISTNQQLEGLLQDVLANTEKVKDLAKQMGIEGDAPAAEGGK